MARTRAIAVAEQARVRFRLLETVYVSAGRRGLELEIAPHDLLRLTGGEARQIAARR